MKRFILFTLIVALMATVMPKASQAQSTKGTSTPAIVATQAGTHTSTNTDTLAANFLNIGSHLKTVTAVVTVLSGTATGTVLLQGSNNGTTWYDVVADTLLVKQSGVNKKFWRLTSTDFNSYRTYYLSTGTQTSTLVSTMCRRPDEDE